MSQVHPLARTTPRTRTEIKASSGSLSEVAERYNITVATARKWKGRDDPQDRSHRPHKLSTTLTPAQELLVVELRRTLLLPLDDLLVVTREFINADVSRSGLDRCLAPPRGLGPEEPAARDRRPLQGRKDLQGLRARLPAHRHQIPATDAR